MLKAEGEEEIRYFKYFLLCDVYMHVVIKGTLQGPGTIRNTITGKLQSLIKCHSSIR